MLCDYSFEIIEEFFNLGEKYKVLGGKTGTLTNYGANNLSFIASYVLGVFVGGKILETEG